MWELHNGCRHWGAGAAIEFGFCSKPSFDEVRDNVG